MVRLRVAGNLADQFADAWLVPARKPILAPHVEDGVADREDINTMRLRTKTPRRARNGRIERPDYPSQAAILERLEVTKKYGLVADYLVSWSGIAGRHSAKVTVWSKDGTPTDVVQHYIARLL